MSDIQDVDVELADRGGGGVEDSRSSFSERERRRLVHSLSTTHDDNSERRAVATSCLNRKTQYSLLDLFRLVQHYRIQTFSIEVDQKWNIRPELGKGASFAVDEAGLSMSSTLSHLQYRSLDVKGPNQDSHFVDHTNTSWSRDSPVAFKYVGSGHAQLTDLVTELQILCHPPLQQHPHIVSLLGVVLVMEQDPTDVPVTSLDQAIMEWDPQEVPMLVIEKAPHASLSAFLSSSEFCDIPSSLQAKLYLCIDILDGMQALHACEILHTDIKCDNILVFQSSHSTAQNWTAKIADFGHSVFNINRVSVNEPPVGFVGSPFYCPPELSCSTQDFSPFFLTKVDTWCWGILFWEVLTNGEGTKDYELHDMYRLREQGLISTTAKQGCIEFLNANHGQERSLFGTILEALEGSLHPDPSKRFSVMTLTRCLKGAVNRQSEYAMEASEPKSIDSLPFIDITRLYYELGTFATIPARIYKELQHLHNQLSSGRVLDATYQMGLCHIPGFGTDRDYNAAMNFILDAANENHLQAKAVALRVANALGVDLPKDLRSRAEEFASEAFERGCRTAMWDRGHFSSALYESSQVERRDGDLPMNLLLDLRQGRFMKPTSSFDLTTINSRGEHGDTPLHWATLLPGTHSTDAVRLMIEIGAEMELATFTECLVSEFPNGTDIMPANTTALEWAVIIDNVEAVIVIVEKMRKDRTDAVSNSALTWTRPTTLLSYAAQYQSLRCLELFCNAEEEYDVNSFDSRGFSPFYFAVRPDIFGRVLRYDCSLQSSDQGHPPFIAREIGVMKKLQGAGSDLVVHSQEFFTCIHMVSAQGGLEVLEYLLDNGGEDLIDVYSDRRYVPLKDSQSKWTPLRDAIIRGNIGAFNILLNRGAYTKQMWLTKTNTYDSLHVCCMFPGSQALEMAKKILDVDSSALKSRSKRFETPLHVASLYGHLKLIDLFIAKGARLLDRLPVCISPLGIAIRVRHVLAVALISSKHREQNTVLMAARGVWICRLPQDTRVPLPLGGKYTSALEYLLTPGCHSPNARIKHDRVPLQLDQSIMGCCDIPFSKVSLKIVDILLANYKHKTQWISNLYLSITYPAYRYDSGLRWAVRTSNFEAVKHILAAHNHDRPLFDVDPRDLIHLACSQVSHGMSHVGSPKTRQNLVEYLRNAQTEEFRFNLEGRTKKNPSLILRKLWRVYYRVYASMEQAQYERAIDWQLKIRRRHDSGFLQFRQWNNPRFSIYIVVYCFLWALLLPAIVYYAIIARDPSSHISPANLVCMIVVVIFLNVLPLWPKGFRITCVLFNRGRKEFPGDQWAIALVQFAVCLLIIGVAVIEMWLLDPSNTHLERFSVPIPSEVGGNFLDLTPWRRPFLSRFQSLCQTLMAWVVFSHIIPPMILMWNLALLYISYFVDISYPNHRELDFDAPVPLDSERTYNFHPRVMGSIFI